jgi:DNA-binding MarR family transcriptional regulator
MRSLADEWECDASNATWIVDRLERSGLAERRTVARDRRVKLVVLTPKGAETKRELMEEFHSPPPSCSRSTARAWRRSGARSSVCRNRAAVAGVDAGRPVRYTPIGMYGALQLRTEPA